MIPYLCMTNDNRLWNLKEKQENIGKAHVELVLPVFDLFHSLN